MKNIRLTSFALSLMLFGHLLYGCAPQGFIPVKEPTFRVESNGFMVLPPTGPDWYMQQGEDFVSFAKNLGSKTHTVAVTTGRHIRIQPELAGYGEYASNPEVFAAYVKTNIEYMNPPAGRMRIVELSVVPDTRYGYCAKFYAKFEDHGSPVAPKILLQEDWGYSCLHPDSSRDIIETDFSERGLPGESDPSLANVREQFFKSLQFSSLD